MNRTLIKNIHLVNVREENKLLRGQELAQLPIIENGFILIEEGKIKNYGLMENVPSITEEEIIDGEGRYLIPSWCDSHTHLVFAKSREEEFIDKIKGLSYAEIAAKGGGILNSARKLQETSENDLFKSAKKRLEEIIQMGTGAIEIKSGYGLTVEAELKMLRVIQRLKESSPIPIKATFLGAHAFPTAYKENKEGYIQLILNEMLPEIEKQGLADYIDVFCETGFFSVKDTERICKAGIERGLKPKIHANQLNASGGTEIGVKLGAVSVDHLETMSESAIEALSNSNTIGTMLPSAAFYLRMDYPPVREMIDRNCALALATDYNPGSSPSGNMNLLFSLACIQMKMLPAEVINCMTLNGAYAMELEQEVGSITKGKRANFILTKKVPSLNYLPYAFGGNHIEQVMVNGSFL
ncbi:imidazolonepropionase [Flavobacteriaceae bacterium UJ101]|nr:imidazolonepropionase [Flavobacteriaceae bacterium UJ101]